MIAVLQVMWLFCALALAENASSLASNCPIEIDAWSGRLGNNLLQIINAFHIGMCTGLPVKLPAHKSAMLRAIANHTHTFECMQCNAQPNEQLRRARYFYPIDITRLGVQAPTFKQKRYIAMTAIRPLLVFDFEFTDTIDTLTVHVRSGDVFTNHPHPAYWQPPLWWYLNISANHRSVFGATAPLVVVTEPDGRNPVINELRKRQWLIVSRTVEEDFGTLVHARSLGLSLGTFSLTAALCSMHATTLYLSAWTRSMGDFWINDTVIRHLHRTYLPNFVAGPWEGNTLQQKLLIDYEPRELASRK